MTEIIGDADLLVIPRPRSASCPLAPPPEFAEWRASTGLRRVMWMGRPTWVVSRYEDIRSSLVDPRLSAETIKTRLRAEGVTGELPVIFARSDDPET